MENKKDKHILIFNRSFWPDIEATGQFLTELSEGLIKKYRVTVIAGRSYYKKDAFKIWEFYKKERFNGIDILRVHHTRFWKKSLVGRIINWLTYSIMAFLISFRIKPTLIIACTDSPFLGIIAMFIKWIRRIPFLYYCNDLFPDVAVRLEKIDENNLLIRIFDYFNRKAFNSAKVVICVGKSMEEGLETKGILKEHIEMIPFGLDTSRIKPLQKSENPLLEKYGLKDKFIIMYSGNIGLSQNFSAILKSIDMLKNKPNFYLIFIGEGAGKESLKKEADCTGLKNILFLTYQPKDLLSFSLSMADLHLIPLKKGLSGTIVPSKVYNIMAVGRPYLTISDAKSEPARLAQEHGCGLWAEPNDIFAISNVFNWAFEHPDELEGMGKIGRQIAETRFDKNIVINEWFKLLENLDVM